MRRLTLIRHAKSSWKDDHLPDHDRPLAKRGERDAPRMGERLRARGARPSLIMSSTAARAKRTAQIIADCLGYPREFLHYAQSLYLASPVTLLATIASQNDRYAEIMLIGHNPGLLELTRRLLPDWPHANLPTTGIVAIDFEAEAWATVTDAPARCVFYDYPKNPEPVLPD